MALPRARSPDSIEAEKMFHDGMALVDIAKKLGKPEGTVRRWKSTQNWDGNSKKKKNKASVRKKIKRAFAKEEDSLGTKTARGNRMQRAWSAERNSERSEAWRVLCCILGHAG